jgi:hypothetical protein
VTASPQAVPAERRASYARLLRLRRLHLRAWQRAVLGEGSLVLAVLLVLADLASAWALLVVPVLVAVLVKAHDVVAGLLQAAGTPTAPVREDRRRRGDRGD